MANPNRTEESLGKDETKNLQERREKSFRVWSLSSTQSGATLNQVVRRLLLFKKANPDLAAQLRFQLRYSEWPEP